MLIKRKTKKYDHFKGGDITIGDPCMVDGNCPGFTVSVSLPENDYRFDYYVGVSAELSDFKYETISPTQKELDDFTESIKGRNMVIIIQQKGRHFSLNSPKYEYIGCIGVDSGLAGFFWDTDIDADNDEFWNKFCNDFSGQNNEVAYDKYGFYCSSGLGDGMYDVYAIIESDEIISLKICF